MADRPKRRPPAKTPEGRENQLISLAYDEAERRILNGTASSQLLTHFLKLGTPKEKLEREKLQKENELLTAKTDAINSSQEIKVLYEEAIDAMKRYSGRGSDD